MNHYKKIIITNFPAFYKINLFNAISKYEKILVIYTFAKDSCARTLDFFKGQPEFDFIALHGPLLKKLIRLRHTLINNEYDELIIGSWDSLEAWYAAFFGGGEKSLIVESSIHESGTSTIKKLIKKIFLTNISKVYVPGISNKALLETLEFDGEIVMTHGVGIFNYINQPEYKPINVDAHKFLFVGRLSEEKNIEKVIRIFNNHPEWTLTIVGFGHLENHLKLIANSNIIFYGAVDNQKLPQIYQSNHIFILPSLSEPWGVVVEEALNNGLPVAGSNMIGCAENWLIREEYGLTFDPNDASSIESALIKISQKDRYNNFAKNISNLNFGRIMTNQILSYVK